MDSSDDEGGDNDFFGLSSTQSNIPTIITHVPGYVIWDQLATLIFDVNVVIHSVPLLPSYGLSDEAGPVRPDPIVSTFDDIPFDHPISISRIHHMDMKVWKMKK